MRISIITPSYNQVEYLGQVIDCVRGQRGDFDVEHIVVDGGSTDGSVELLREQGERLKWISEPDEGQSDAINKGLRLATGEIIGWLNSDDIYLEGCFAKVSQVFAAEPQTQWAYGKVRIVDEQNNEIRRWITKYKNSRMKSFSFAKLLTENWISQMGVFWRREFGEQVGELRTDLHYTMDYDLWLRMGTLAPGRFIDGYLAAFRWYPTSKSGHAFDVQMTEGLQVAIQHAHGKYPWSIFCHRFNRFKIVTAYHLLRWLRR